MRMINYSRIAAWHRAQPLQTRAVLLLIAFRFILSFIFILTIFYINDKNWFTQENQLLFFKFSVSYFIFSVICIVMTALKVNDYSINFPFQIFTDIVFIILLMHAAGGITSGLGLLLIIVIVIASLVSQGRLALFYAAIATIGLLLEHSLQILLLDLTTSSYTQSVMLSLSCFATAWLAHSLGTRMQQSEAIASARGVDLENMAHINALITQEMQDGVIVVDEHLTIRHRNLQANTLLSLPEIPNQPLSLTEHLPDIAKLYKLWLNGNEDQENYNISINNQELKLRFMPVNQQMSAQHLGAVIFIQDWSQLQSKAQQAKLAALGRLTAHIAHEVRNPLSAISHANQLLQEEDQNSSNTRILQIIEDNIHRIDKIIKDVLELNRRDRTHQEPIELNKFIADFHSQFCAIEKIATTHFTLTPLPASQMVLFDQRHLMQILWNLCKNGWEHSQKNTNSLNLELKNVVAHFIHIVITDDGAGVVESNRAKLFEPFYTTKSTGSGLGLYISRELAEANGASLQYQALTQGSAFILQLKKVNLK
jgi:two-component system sensor histidine kinase PilS (NtrC family)